jgi:secreted trypsin-like serine protease
MKTLGIIFAILSTSSCGNVDIDSAINGGVESFPHQYPFAVAVRSRNPIQGTLLCGGAIISRRAFLTAASCVARQLDIQVILGAQNINDPSETHQLTLPIDSSLLNIHPDWVSGQTTNDIATVFFPAQIGFFNHAINFVVLHTDPNEDLVGLYANTMGWGTECIGTNCPESNTLRDIQVRIYVNSECDHVGISQPSQMCAWNFTGGPCRGDWGNPLVIQRNGSPILVGIVETLGNLCRGVAIYTHISSFLPWIRDHM